MTSSICDSFGITDCILLKVEINDKKKREINKKRSHKNLKENLLFKPLQLNYINNQKQKQ